MARLKSPNLLFTHRYTWRLTWHLGLQYPKELEELSEHFEGPSTHAESQTALEPMKEGKKLLYTHDNGHRSLFNLGRSL